MAENRKERWFELCELASKEQDPKKLLALIAEIDRLLTAKDMNKNTPRSGTAA